MPMTERSRHKLYETFTALIDDETAVQEMLSYFPARDVEEPVTKDFLRAELQTEIGTACGPRCTRWRVPPRPGSSAPGSRWPD
jgi:hypothetical protein